MAVWQFDLVVACNANERDLPTGLARLAKAHLDRVFGPPTRMLEGWDVYGPEQGSRVDFVTTDSDGCELSFRIDARSDADSFINSMVEFVQALDGTILDAESGLPIETSVHAIREALMASPAWTYALDPSTIRPADSRG